MKKGYIFSWYNSGRNYGQTLQAYALQKVLDDMGYDVKHVCFGTNRDTSVSIINKLRDFKNLSVSERKIQSKFDFFIANYMRVTKRLNDDKQVKEYINKNKSDFLVCGSDQVWNPYNVHPFYYLAEVGNKNINRIAYAVSTCDTRRKNKFLEYPQIKNWIEQIDHLYVRENSGKDIFSELFSVDSEVVLDPTLLLSGNEWIKNLRLKKEKDNYILCYAFNLTKEQKKLMEKRAKQKKCKIKYGNILENNNIKKEAWSPIDFLEAILNSKEVFTDSFHGTAFSILFHKNFTVFDNGSSINSDPYYNIDRMNTLLQLVKLEKRIFVDSKNYNEEDIDFKKVDKILKQRREECLALLKGSIG